MKKVLFVIILFSVLITSTNADDLADLLQDLAVQIACRGMYSKAQTGVYVTSRYDDPVDWYDPPMMANRFAAMSGNMTRITTFYGVCFDYAQFAWNDIKEHQKKYNEAGMKGTQWYIAMTNIGNADTIILYDPVSKEKATIISNGVYLKENSRHRIYAHDGASGHAWLWVQHKNGTWYWIDPTWTDNTGYVWWGIVKDGREVQNDPNSEYCVTSNYPKFGVTYNETGSSNSILVYTREVPASNQGIANASPGDYIIRSSGEKVVLKQADIDYARKQLGLTTTPNKPTSPGTSNSASSETYSSNFGDLFGSIIVIVIFAMICYWALYKELQKQQRLQKKR